MSVCGKDEEGEERRSELNWFMVDRVEVRAARVIGNRKEDSEVGIVYQKDEISAS